MNVRYKRSLKGFCSSGRTRNCSAFARIRRTYAGGTASRHFVPSRGARQSHLHSSSDPIRLRPRFRPAGGVSREVATLTPLAPGVHSPGEEGGRNMADGNAHRCQHRNRRRLSVSELGHHASAQPLVHKGESSTHRSPELPGRGVEAIPGGGSDSATIATLCIRTWSSGFTDAI